MFTDVRVWDRNTWQERETQTALAKLAPPKQKHPGGRKPKFLWEDFWLELTRRVHEEGIPEKQSEIVRYMGDWCRKNWPEAPDDDTIEIRIRKLFEKLRP